MPNLLKEILDKIEGVLLPRTAALTSAPAHDGIYDPLGDQELLTPNRRGSFFKDTNGKLYYPFKAGFMRQKVIVEEPYGEPQKITTTDDTAKEIAVSTYPTDGEITGFKIITVYQNSGGALTFSLLDSSGATTLYTKSVNNTTYTVLDLVNQLLGPYKAGNGTINGLSCKWSAAAGASQAILVQWYIARAVEVNLY